MSVGVFLMMTTKCTVKVRYKEAKQWETYIEPSEQIRILNNFQHNLCDKWKEIGHPLNRIRRCTECNVYSYPQRVRERERVRTITLPQYIPTGTSRDRYS